MYFVKGFDEIWFGLLCEAVSVLRVKRCFVKL